MVIGITEICEVVVHLVVNSEIVILTLAQVFGSYILKPSHKRCHGLS